MAAAISYAAGLRELADWIDENEGLLKAHDFSPRSTLLICRGEKDEFLEAAQALGIEHSEMEQKGRYLNVTRHFGPIDVQVYIDAVKVGTPTTRLRPTTEWELDPEVSTAFASREPTDEEVGRSGPHVPDTRHENDEAL